MSISPAAQTVSPGESFDIVVTLNTDTPSRGGQCSLNFNAALVQCNGVTEGSFYHSWVQSHGGSAVVFPQPVIHNDAGRVTDVGIAIMGGGTGGPSGSGEFCIYHMTAKTGVTGTSVIVLSNVVLTNQSGKSVSSPTVNNGQVLVISPSTVTAPPMTSPAVPRPSSTTPVPPTKTTDTVNPSTETALPPLTPTVTPTQESDSQPTVIDLSATVNSEGVLQMSVDQGDIRYGENGWTLRLEIGTGARALTKDGEPLQAITIQPNATPSPPPSGKRLVGFAIDLGPPGAIFSPPMSAIFNYDPNLLPRGVKSSELILAYFDAQKGEWIECNYVADPKSHSITGYIDHFTTFSILARENKGIGWSLAAIIILSELVVAAIVIFFIVRRRRSSVRAAISPQTPSSTALSSAERKVIAGDSQADSLSSRAKFANAAIKTRIETTTGKLVFTSQDKLPSNIEIVNASGCDLVVSVEYDPELYPEGVTKITVVEKESQ
ncbi:MAG: hypothetical protein PHV74_04220 [Dehalococcoidia bacterium]|nr:hypothetical protein [Dehalococcoidia bacterium]